MQYNNYLLKFVENVSITKSKEDLGVDFGNKIREIQNRILIWTWVAKFVFSAKNVVAN